MSNRASSCSSPLTTRDAEACTILSTIAPDRVPARGAHMGQRAGSSDVLRGVPRRLGRRWSQRLCVSVRDATRRSPAGFARPVVPVQKAAPSPTFRRAPSERPMWVVAMDPGRGHRIETCGRDYHYPKSPPPPPRTCAPCCHLQLLAGSVTRPGPLAGRTPWQSSTSGLAALRLYRQRYALTPCPALC